MPVNPELQGRVLPAAAPYLVGREKVREFARAVGATHPVHLDPEAARAAGIADAFKLSGILGVILGLFCFTLPATPPQQGKQSFAAGEALRAAGAFQ